MKALLLFALVSCTFFVQAETHVVEIYKFKYRPNSITIKSGDSITWVNKEKRQYHSVVFEDEIKADSNYLFPEDSWTYQFNIRGDFNYHCEPHPEMLGAVKVELIN